MIKTQPPVKLTCYHCGEDCPDDTIRQEDKHFCCEGCKLVFNLLDKNGLCTYYTLDKNPGISRRIQVREGKFGFLDDEQVKNRLISFTDGTQYTVNLYLPQMHCSSCIWLLENLHRLESGIVSSRVDFPAKEVSIVFNGGDCSLRKVAELLTEIGYEPHISLKDMDERKIQKTDRKRLLQLGVAGFCFGNIMMFSFPEYFANGTLQPGLKHLFLYLNLALALPVFFFSASEFYISAWKGIRSRFLNIDAPIVLAIVITYTRSVYEILSGTGSGYLDSMSGIVFFMLAGRVFQDYTHQALSFERDYKSYFPISVTVKAEGNLKETPISSLVKGDRIVIRNGELIPADGILFLGEASIDYSFVTGESTPVTKTIGEIIYAGGRQCGGKMELEVVREVPQSYLTRLWSKDTFQAKTKGRKSFIHALSRNFTWALLSLAALAAIYWGMVNPSRMLNAVTATLIVACPCALLLSSTFTNGNIVRILSRQGLYLKNAEVIESLAGADTIVFDKTGTLTESGASVMTYSGAPLSETERIQAGSLALQSIHPLSRAIAAYLQIGEALTVKQFTESPGKGTTGEVNKMQVKLGSPEYTGVVRPETVNASQVYLFIDGIYKGYFRQTNPYRQSFPQLIQSLHPKYRLAVLSGDNAAERSNLAQVMGPTSELLFEQSPQDKLNYILSLQKAGKQVIMVGDGLNDAGALRQSDAGIALSDDINNFSPACDAILESKHFSELGQFIRFAKAGKRIILGSFVISVLYNIAGLSFAVQGILSPVIAAILMPLSSISILLFTTGASALAGKWFFRKSNGAN